MKRKYINVLIYVSILFLVYKLIKNNYLNLPIVRNWAFLLFSVVLLFGLFLSYALVWHKILGKHEVSIKFPISLSSTGLPVFAKYIPVPIWNLLGQVGYVSNYTGTPIKQLTAISLENLVISMWFGLLFGMIGVLLLRGLHLFGWLIVIFWVPLTMLIFSKVVYLVVGRLVKKLFRKEFTIPWLDIKSKLTIMPWYILSVFLQAFGFYYFAASLSVSPISFSVGLGLPLAGTLGILAFFAPGALGVREGILVGYLKLAGFPTEEAVTISVASRVWVLLGEAFIFVLGFLSDKRMKLKRNKQFLQPAIDRKRKY